ncbi:MAG: hypothetical protein AB1505_24665 [Candidatus Latescibacterota bacterium]
MRFRTAVQATPELRAHLKPALEALGAAAQSGVHVPEQGRLSGSVDIDAALRGQLQNEPRWDYAIGYRTGRRDDRVYYVEQHKAEATEVGRVLGKKQWLERWLATTPLDGVRPRDFVWLSAGGVRIPANSPAARLLSLHGVTLLRRLVLSAR